MKILDCESIDSTYASMEKILSIERPRLEELLGNLDLEEERGRAGSSTPGEILLHAVMSHGAAEPKFDRTCWFHLSRTHPRNTFSRGLLPLNEAMPHIWGLLLMLLPEDFPLEKWYGFAKNPPLRLHPGRLQDSETWGPFALLPREAVLSPGDSGSLGSLETPEIVGDICAALQEEHGIDLLPTYRRSTRPCIVKFIGEETGPEHLGTALHYLHGELTDGRIPAGCRAHFDAGGRGIPPDKVLDVTFL
jgi:hypothetical protein